MTPASESFWVDVLAAIALDPYRPRSRCRDEECVGDHFRGWLAGWAAGYLAAVEERWRQDREDVRSLFRAAAEESPRRGGRE